MSGHAHATNPRKEALTYAGVLGTLLVLTFITVGASYIHFGSSMVNVVVAITIATIKASLVALFFMHLLHEKAINSLIFVISAFMLALFLIACYTDYAARDPLLPANYKPATAPPGTAGSTAPAPAPAEH